MTHAANVYIYSLPPCLSVLQRAYVHESFRYVWQKKLERHFKENMLSVQSGQVGDALTFDLQLYDI